MVGKPKPFGMMPSVPTIQTSEGVLAQTSIGVWANPVDTFDQVAPLK
jgi:hypothetical protein